jgi:hypothetical protein
MHIHFSFHGGNCWLITWSSGHLTDCWLVISQGHHNGIPKLCDAFGSQWSGHGCLTWSMIPGGNCFSGSETYGILVNQFSVLAVNYELIWMPTVETESYYSTDKEKNHPTSASDKIAHPGSLKFLHCWHGTWQVFFAHFVGKYVCEEVTPCLLNSQLNVVQKNCTENNNSDNTCKYV